MYYVIPFVSKLNLQEQSRPTGTGKRVRVPDRRSTCCCERSAKNLTAPNCRQQIEGDPSARPARDAIEAVISHAVHQSTFAFASEISNALKIEDAEF